MGATAEDADKDDAEEEARSSSTESISRLPIPIPTIFVRDEKHELRYSFPEPDFIPPILFEPVCLSCPLPAPSNYPSPSSSPPSFSSSPIDVLVFTSKRAYRRQVVSWQCSVCNHINRYDGLHHHLFFYSSTRLFTHELLNDFTIRYCRSHTTFSSFWFSVAAKYQASMESERIAASSSSSSSSSSPSASPLPFVSHPTLRDAWFSFIRLQCWKYEFSCSICGPHPAVVLADGLTLSLPRKYLKSVVPPTLVTSSSPVVNRKRLGKEARFLRYPQTAALVRKHTGRLYGRDGGKKMELTQDEEKKMMEDLEKHGEKELGAVCVFLIQLRTEPQYKLKHYPELCRWLARLVRILCSSEPLVCFLPFIATSALRSTLLKHSAAFAAKNPLLATATAEEASTLARYCPFVQQFFSFFALNRDFVHSKLIALLLVACDRVEQYEQRQQQQQQQQQQQEQEQGWIGMGSYYGMQAIRVRPKYEGLDGVESKTAECTKKFAAFNGISGGCMVLWCPHRIALGFHVIPSAEGRNDVFSAIFLHWPTAPKVIVYDFACSLQPYCLAREPNFFKNTTFVIDRLHSKNHSTCSEAFDLQSFRVSGNPLFYINDSAQEQGNKGLAAIRISCLYMRLERFIPFVKLHLETANCRRLAKLQL